MSEQEQEIEKIEEVKVETQIPEVISNDVPEIIEIASTVKVAEVVIANQVISAETDNKKIFKKDFSNNRGGRGGKNNKGGSRPARAPREKSEFDSKTIDVRRVVRVVSGGRRFSLSVAVALGDKNGRVGFGTGKALDTQAAIEKATKSARKNMITLKLNKNKSIPYDVEVKYKSGQVWLTPNKGKGLIAGSSARSILALAGVNNVTAKFHSGTKNKINNARVVMKALGYFTK